MFTAQCHQYYQLLKLILELVGYIHWASLLLCWQCTRVRSVTAGQTDPLCVDKTSCGVVTSYRRTSLWAGARVNDIYSFNPPNVSNYLTIDIVLD